MLRKFHPSLSQMTAVEQVVHEEKISRGFEETLFSLACRSLPKSLKGTYN